MESSRMLMGGMDESMDVMMMSSHTYIVPRGGGDSYTAALNASILDELDMSNHNSVNSSMVLEHPVMDIDLLPIIGDEELETPHIPNITMRSTLQKTSPNANKPEAKTMAAKTPIGRTNGNPPPAVMSVPTKAVAPKKPSKNQLIYEKIRQSLENEKAKPKREVRSKVSESLKTFAAPKNPSREPSSLKAASIGPTKSRALSSSRTNVAAANLKAPAKPIVAPTRPNTIPLKPQTTNRPALPPPSRTPTSRSTQSLATLAKTPTGKPPTAKPNPDADRIRGLRRVASQNAVAFTAMATLLENSQRSLHSANQKAEHLHDELMSTEKANEELKAIISKHIEQSEISMEDMNRNFDLILKEKSEDYEHKILCLKDQFENQVAVLERQIAEEKERQKIQPVRLSSGQPNVCPGNCNDEVNSLMMTIQFKTEEIHQLRGDTRVLELKNETLSTENKQIGAMNAKLERLNHYVRQYQDNEKQMQKLIGQLQRSITDQARKNVDLQHQLDVCHFKLSEAHNQDMSASDYSNDSHYSTNTQPISGKRELAESPTPNLPPEMITSTPMVWSSVYRKTKPRESHDEIYDDTGRLVFNDSGHSGLTADQPDGSESSKENYEHSNAEEPSVPI